MSAFGRQRKSYQISNKTRFNDQQPWKKGFIAQQQAARTSYKKMTLKMVDSFEEEFDGYLRSSL